MGQPEQTTRNMLVKLGVVAQYSGSFNRIESSRSVWAAYFQACSGEDGLVEAGENIYFPPKEGRFPDRPH